MSRPVICDGCGQEHSKYQRRLVDKTWLVVTDEWGNEFDFCSTACLAMWATKVAKRPDPNSMEGNPT